MKKTITTCILLLFVQQILLSQFEQFENLEETTTKGFWSNHFRDLFKISNYIDLSNPLIINGGFNAETRFYDAKGIDPQQSPFYWVMSGNVNAKIYGFDVPVSFLLSTDKKELTKPQGPDLPNIKEYVNNRFTRIGASPSYKWIKLHIGHRTMDFSPLILASLPYFGIGAEANPGNLRIAYFRGRLADAKPRDLSLLQPNIPVFSRHGYGGKIGYGNSQNYIDVMLVRGGDDMNSIDITPDFPTTPLSNTVYSLQGRKEVGKISLEAKYAESATNPNIWDEANGSIKFPFSLFGEGSRPSTVIGYAIEGALNYSHSSFTTGLQYKRVSDGYQSIGIPFINSDIEEYNGSFSSQLFKGALQYNLTAGLQRDNLSGKKDQSILRFIYTINTSYANGPFSISANYDNNSFSTDYLLSSDLDSLDVVAVTRNGGVNIGYNLATKSNYSHSFALAGNVSDISDDLDFSNAESTMYNATFTYGFTTPSKLNLNVTAGYNKTDSPQNTFNRNLFGIGVRKSLLDDKLQLNAQGNYFNVNTKANGSNVKNSALNFVGQISYKINPSHTFYARMNSVQRATGVPLFSEKGIRELIFNLGYRMNFSYSYSKTIQSDEK